MRSRLPKMGILLAIGIFVGSICFIGLCLGQNLVQISEWPVQGVPSGIAVGPGGEVYVSFNEDHRVVGYTGQGESRTEFDVDGVIETNGIVVGPGGEVYVNINQNHKVVKYSTDGEKIVEWSTGEPADGLAVAPSGEVFVNINQNHRVVEYSPVGQMQGALDYEGEAGAIATGPDGYVYIATPQQVVKYGPDGERLERWTVEDAETIDKIFVDQHGDVYVNINNSHRVVRYSAGGERVSQGDLEGNFSDAAIGPDGLIYVTDVDNNTVRIFQI